MTDEELAKRWVGYHYDPAVKLNRCSLEWAFLAGLKEGKEMAEADLATAKEIIKSLLSLKSKIDWSNLTFEEQEDLQTDIDIAERFLDSNYLEEQE